MEHRRAWQRRIFMDILLGMMLVFGLVAPVRAQAPLAKTQAPGYYRMMLGQFEVTALYDGSIDLDAKLLHGAPADTIQNLLARMFIIGPKLPTSVNAYLINTGTHLVLVDVGAAKLFGPTLGHVLSNLKAAGYDPAQIDAVLITHLHGDHMGGLLDASGKPAFAKATVYVSQTESDFYLSPQRADKMPADLKPYFKMARDIAAPYIAVGRWKTFTGGDLTIPGIKALAIPGHTPGHTAYEVRSGNQTLLIWGDLVHCLAVQMAKPNVSIDFDTDQAQAVATRQALFKRIAAEKFLTAGMHMPFPGLGRVHLDGDNVYSWVPIEYMSY